MANGPPLIPTPGSPSRVVYVPRYFRQADSPVLHHTPNPVQEDVKPKVYNPNDYLRGRLEAVKIIHPRGNSAYGEIVREGKGVIVKYGHLFVDETVLVRMDLFDQRVKGIKKTARDPQASLNKLVPIGNFISDEISADYRERIMEEGVSPSKLAFYAIFPEDGTPTLFQVNRYFEPGSMGSYVFLRAGEEGSIDLTLVDKDRQTPIDLDGTSIIDLLPLIIFERLI